MNQTPVVTIARYRKPDGYETRFWTVYLDGELLAVVVYRKGARAVADLILSTRAGTCAGQSSIHRSRRHPCFAPWTTERPLRV